MDIHIPSEERLRLSTNKKSVYIDVSAAPHQECLTVEFYSFQKQVIKLKQGVYKMFIFQKDQDISDFDFGFWADYLCHQSNIVFKKGCNFILNYKPESNEK